MLIIFLYAAACWPVVAVLLVAAICRAVHKSKACDEAAINARFIA